MNADRALEIHPTAIVDADVTFLGQAHVGAYCTVGVENRHAERHTLIGDGAVIRSGSIIYAGNLIGRHFQTGNSVNIREMNEIGNGVSVGTHTVVEHHIKIGDNVRIHSQAFIPEYTIIENDVWIGPNVVLTNARYPANAKTKASLNAPVCKAGCIIGANTTILPGVTIGERALIGAGSVVTKDVPAGAVMKGNPAQQFKSVSEIEDY